MNLRLFRCLALCLVLAATGCRRGMDRAELVLINGAEPELLDPVFANAQATGRLIYALLEGLLVYDVQGKPSPGVAERWEISPDGLRYTFHLRHNARWSNGDPVTARDFAWSWQRTLTPENAAEYAYQLYYIKGARDFNEGKTKDFATVGVRVVDEFTLMVELENPTPFFLSLCSFATLVPVHRATVEKYQDWSSNPAHYVGNGPFLLKEWRLFDRVRLERSPTYWNTAQVGMKNIDVLPAARAITAFNLYSTGVADLMIDKNVTPTALIDQLKLRKDYHAAPFLGAYFFRFNCSPDRKVSGQPNPFVNPKVRLAFKLAVDRVLITEKITRAGELPAWSYVPPGAGQGYQSPEPSDPVWKAGHAQPEEARRLLAEAGFPGGKGFPIFYYLYRSDNDVDQDIAVELQAMFKQVLGVDMLLTRQEWTVYLNSQSKLDFDLSRSTWVGDYNDPNTFMDMYVTGGGNNRTGWSNRTYDELIASAGREPDHAKRNAMFQQAERILVEDEAPIVPLYYYVNVQFYDGDRLGGIEPNLIDEHPFKTLHWKK